MTYDVVVVGAGIVGCVTAASLARRGARVAVFDAGPVGAGASGRNAGLVEHPFEAEQVALHEETVAILRDVLGADVVPAEPTGALLLFGDAAGAERAVAEAAAFPELAPALLAPGEVTALEPGVRDGLWGCLLATGHPLRPAAAVHRFAGLARERGATLVTDAPVALHRDGGTVRGVVAGGEVHRADVVVVAAGAASSALVDPTGRWRPVRPVWGVSVSIDGGARPRVPLMDGRGELPPKAFSLIATPSELALGSTWLADEPDGAPWATQLLADAAAFWPAATTATIAATRVCARPHAFDGRPLLGPVAGDPTLWLATGHGGRGISTGAASAHLLADALLAGDAAAIPPALRADRAGPPPRSA
ncbi:MAG TPA: FAD-dependent oxidoreductase [Baekduia sp.]|uniref:NAD(P)/FAD-dependent oxidoreductase n=1 Tax=Baekduia sp. TaxID=2600305 RepID=UPI002D790D96|nr:FAD-dependent oxidoreductase [Baekduia sp.]HET6505292.1 FAD-dependent oxidoreductase [Baekduia sp.]